MAQTFKDLVGATWSISFTVGDAMKLRRELGIDVDQLIQGNNQELEKILSDMWRLLEILVLLLEAQIERKGMFETITVDGEERRKPTDSFYERFGGDVIDEAMIAFLYAIGDSLPKLKRRALQAIVKKISPAIDHAATKIEEKIATMNIKTRIDQGIEEAM